MSAGAVEIELLPPPRDMRALGCICGSLFESSKKRIAKFGVVILARQGQGPDQTHDVLVLASPSLGACDSNTKEEDNNEGLWRSHNTEDPMATICAGDAL